MKLAGISSRLALLSLGAAAFAGLTEIYGGSVRLLPPDRQWRALREHRPSAPQISRFAEFIGEGAVLAIYAVAGRKTFRLRLSPPSRSEGQPILLKLYRRG